jgi:hypothetical protein
MGGLEVNITCDTSPIQRALKELEKHQRSIINIPPRRGKGKKPCCKECDYFSNYLVDIEKIRGVKPVGECLKLDKMVSKHLYLDSDHLKTCPLAIKGQEADYLVIDDPIHDIEKENFEKQYQQSPIFHNGWARCVLGVENK